MLTHGLSIQRLSANPSSETRHDMIDLLLQWNKDITLSKIVGKEHKMILLWYKSFDLLWSHLKANPNDKIRVRPHCHTMLILVSHNNCMS